MQAMIRWLGLGLLLFGCAGAEAQDISAVFPAQDARLDVADLRTRPFEWTPVQGAAFYEYTLFVPDIISSRTIGPLISTRASIELGEDILSTLSEGDHDWKVVAFNGRGEEFAESSWFDFEIIPPGEDLIPTPTPVNPPPRSADWSGSGRIDAADLFAFSQAWAGSGLASPFDLNIDQAVNARDLLLMIQQYGQPAPTPVPLSAVGPVQNLRFEPGQRVSQSELSSLRVQWDPPAYPEGGAFQYELLVESLVGIRIHRTGLFDTAFQPFPAGSAPIGDYQIYLRALDAQQTPGAIVAATFSVTVNEIGITPTPRPTVDPTLPSPTWSTVVINPQAPPGIKDPRCLAELPFQTILLQGPPYSYTMDQAELCYLFEMAATQFHFEPVDGAQGYEYRYADQQGVMNGPLSTGGEAFATLIPRQRQNEKTYRMEVRGLFADHVLGGWSEPLTIRVPATSQD